MPNKNYEKGRNKEYYTCRILKEKEGFHIAQRTAGSHSPFDIIAINKLTKVIRLVQCKPNNFSQSKEIKILNDNSELNGIYRVEFEVR